MPSSSGEWLDINSPVDGEHVGRVTLGNAAVSDKQGWRLVFCWPLC